MSSRWECGSLSLGLGPDLGVPTWSKGDAERVCLSLASDMSVKALLNS